MIEEKDLKPEELAEVDRQLAMLKRGVVEIIPEEGLRQKLMESIHTGRPLKIKLGVDPSAPDLHLGHTVVLHKLRQFQELGHQIQLVIGDFTGQIGDPTGKSETRKPLTHEQVRENAATYVAQYGKILDVNKVEIHYNASWLAPLNFEQIIRLASSMTVARMLERDDFEKRYQSGQAISLHEFFYPLMQGYDSVHLQSDIELGGTDQKFNLLMGRQLQKEFGQAQQVVMMTPLLEGLDGVKKMSKSLGNYIGVSEEPNEIFGKSMSIPDELMLKYFELATNIPMEELSKLAAGLKDGAVHPRDAKMMLAHRLVAMYHGEEAAVQAQEHFQTVFQQGALPDDIPVVTVEQSSLENGSIWVVPLLVSLDLCSSNGDARRMIQQGAVKLNGERVDDEQLQVAVEDGMIWQVGKRKFAKIHLA